MNRNEKIALQEQQKGKALAFKEGFFYKVYNEGAWLLRKRNYKIQQSGKGAKQCLFVGFPELVLQGLHNDFKIEDKNAYIEIGTSEAYCDINYAAWYEELLASVHTSSKEALCLGENTQNTVIDEIINYPLANKTPIEVFSWIAGLQQRLPATATPMARSTIVVPTATGGPHQRPVLPMLTTAT